MVGALIWGLIALLIISVLTFWVTKKAYSRKWDEEDED
jgi:hypothetical protein